MESRYPAQAVQASGGCTFLTARDRRVLLIVLTWFLVPGASLLRGQTYLQSIGFPKSSTRIPVENGYIDASNGRLHLAGC
jgi:hypothetical protein